MFTTYLLYFLATIGGIRVAFTALMLPKAFALIFDLIKLRENPDRLQQLVDESNIEIKRRKDWVKDFKRRVSCKEAE